MDIKHVSSKITNALEELGVIFDLNEDERESIEETIAEELEKHVPEELKVNK